MDDLINKILDIDKQAQEKINQANKKKIEILRTYEVKNQDLTNELDLVEKEKLNNVYEVENQFAQERIKSADEQKQKTLAEFEDIYKQNHEKWEKEIFDNVVAL